jgi:hypothetical protein
MDSLEMAIQQAVQAAGTGTAAVDTDQGSVVVATPYELDRLSLGRCGDAETRHVLLWVMDTAGPNSGGCRGVTEAEAQGAGLELCEAFPHREQACGRVVHVQPVAP